MPTLFFFLQRLLCRIANKQSDYRFHELFFEGVKSGSQSDTDFKVCTTTAGVIVFVFLQGYLFRVLDTFLSSYHIFLGSIFLITFLINVLACSRSQTIYIKKTNKHQVVIWKVSTTEYLEWWHPCSCKSTHTHVITTIWKWAKNGKQWFEVVKMLSICFCIGEHLNKTDFYNCWSWFSYCRRTRVAWKVVNIKTILKNPLL